MRTAYHSKSDRAIQNKAHFPLGEFVCAKRKFTVKSWNASYFIAANFIASHLVENGLKPAFHLANLFARTEKKAT